MKAHIYLTLSKTGVVKMTQQRPAVSPRQRLIRLQITVPDSAFIDPPDLDAQLDIPADRLAYPPAHALDVEIWTP